MDSLFSRFEPPVREKGPIMGEIYVLHFGRPYRHARHYIGWARKGTVQDRVSEHLRGEGSPLVKAVVEAGIEVTLVGTMPGTRDMERHLKNRHDNRGVCPICRKDWLEKKKMKKEFTIREVREIVRSLVLESTCPVCGGRGAYVGLNDVECPNKACPKYSSKQFHAGDDDDTETDSLPGDYIHLDRYQMQQKFPDALQAWEDEWGPVPTDENHEGVFQWSADEGQLLAVPGELPGVDKIKTWYGDRWG